MEPFANLNYSYEGRFLITQQAGVNCGHQVSIVGTSRIALDLQEIQPKALEQHRRTAEYLRKNPGKYDWKKAVENDALHVGHYFIGTSTELDILQGLITSPRMKMVWAHLPRRATAFKPGRFFLARDKSQAGNLLGACIAAEDAWINVPKRTKVESRKLYGNIAALSIQLAERLLESDSREFMSVLKFIKPEKRQEFIDGLEHDDHKIWHGFDGYLDHLLDGLLPLVPGILLEMHNRALEQQQTSLAVAQPKSPDAKMRYYIRKLSPTSRPLTVHRCTPTSLRWSAPC
jgi:hypothetical protein